ncbi:hypothetical protein [Bradyrhizobium frederickii]|uniref:hypothetical protein n=1 Tax=Bradyrhizobium frederickii TaxID=2560054 RepID=UPI00142F75B3|nr:hypothetical protein [Bradyrhizobium frederickii]
MGRIVRYAVATTMRQEEICRPDWPDEDMKTRVLVIRDRKDPRAKDGNDQKVPLLNLTGFDAWEILLQQRIITRGWGRVFPYNAFAQLLSRVSNGSQEQKSDHSDNSLLSTLWDYC